jgi:hypothetical protein
MFTAGGWPDTSLIQVLKPGVMKEEPFKGGAKFFRPSA